MNINMDIRHEKIIEILKHNIVIYKNLNANLLNVIDIYVLRIPKFI